MFPVCAPAALERPEGVAQQDYVAMEEFQQRTNAFSLEKVKAYYRRLRYAEPAPSRSSHSGTRETFHLFKIGSSPPPRCVSPHRAEERASSALSLFPFERHGQGLGCLKGESRIVNQQLGGRSQGLSPSLRNALWERILGSELEWQPTDLRGINKR